jgi:hypothetical protein
MRELERLVAQVRDAAFDLRILAVRPAGVPAGWERSDLWRSAASIPGAVVMADVHGREARRFGVGTSGTAILYDGDGELVFFGGLTPGRGHEGSNPGEETIAAFLNRKATSTTQSSVYGCPLTASRQATN